MLSSPRLLASGAVVVALAACGGFVAGRSGGAAADAAASPSLDRLSAPLTTPTVAVPAPLKGLPALRRLPKGGASPASPPQAAVQAAKPTVTPQVTPRVTPKVTPRAKPKSNTGDTPLGGGTS